MERASKRQDGEKNEVKDKEASVRERLRRGQQHQRNTETQIDEVSGTRREGTQSKSGIKVCQTIKNSWQPANVLHTQTDPLCCVLCYNM